MQRKRGKDGGGERDSRTLRGVYVEMINKVIFLTMKVFGTEHNCSLNIWNGQKDRASSGCFDQKCNINAPGTAQQSSLWRNR